MKDMTVYYNGEKLPAQKIRYFEYNNSQYLIYDLKEDNDDNYVKLYIVKLDGNIEQVIDDDEWNILKDMIQDIVKEIKSNNIKSFKDLTGSKIDEIDSNYARPFKLKKDLVDIMTYIKGEKKEMANSKKGNDTKKTSKSKEKAKDLEELNEEKESEEIDDSKEEILQRLEEYLKNPVDEYSDVQPTTTVKPTYEIIKTMEDLSGIIEQLKGLQKQLDETNDFCEELKKENQNLQRENQNLENEISEYKNKIDYIKGVIRDL